MTTITDVRPYLRLSIDKRLEISGNVASFLAYAKTRRRRTPQPPLRAPVVALLSPEPPPVTAQPEPEIDFMPKTNTQKRTRQPTTDTTTKAPLYDRTLKDRIATLINERGPLTSADIGRHFNMHRQRTSVVLANMQTQGRLFVVGYKKNEYNQAVKVLHTDPSYPYVSPNMPAAQPVTEEKRPARLPSLAAVDRGRALVGRNFSRDSIAMRVFERLCLRPQSIPELDAFFRCGSSCLKFMLDRMAGLGIVEKVGQERNETAGRIRALWGVVETDELPELYPPRVPPSPETVAKGRALILDRCLKKGGNTLLAFDELCANGPLTRADLQKRLGCHRTMIDTALRKLEELGLVTDTGKSMDGETGHMSRLWDISEFKENGTNA